MVGKDILLDDDQNILGKIGIHIEEQFIGKILKKQNNVGVMPVIKLDIMPMNVLINLLKED